MQQKKNTNHVDLFENLYKIAKNRLILKLFAIPNEQDFTIFKTPYFLNFDKSLYARSSDLQIFASTKILSILQKKIDFSLILNIIFQLLFHINLSKFVFI